MSNGSTLDEAKLYEVRFSDAQVAAKERLWRVLCEDFFQKWIPEDATVLDLACGHGEFIRNIRASSRLAVDASSYGSRFLPSDIRFFQCPANDLSQIESGSVDCAFTSNFFEHLPTKEVLDEVLQEVLRVLRPGGAFIALQPNIKYVGDAYWDFYDHRLPLSHLSAEEGFKKNGFEVEMLIPRFLPYTTKSRLPQAAFLLRMYLKMPWLWKIFGKQFVLVASKPQIH